MASVYKRKGEGNWLAAWHDHNGKRHVESTKTTDKKAAKEIANKLEADAARRRRGVIDPHLEAINGHANRSIESHLADFKAKLKTADTEAGHIRDTLKFIRLICQSAKFKTAADISADGVNHYAKDMKDANKSNRTVQSYLTAIKSFTAWLAETGKLNRDPLVSVEKPNPKTDRRYERRMLLPAEWQWLKSSIAGDRMGMSADERKLFYETAILTGLRSNELRSLTPGKLFLDGDKPYIVCKAKATKNATDARQYISPSLAAGLARHVDRRTRSRPVFDMPDPSSVSDIIRKDLAAAREAWLNEAKDDACELERRSQSDFLLPRNFEGEVLDFHSLRHTCGAWLAMAGAHPKAIQTVMRHSVITLTMDTYGHLFPGQEADTVARLQTMLETLNKSDVQQKCEQLGHEAVLPLATACERVVAESRKEDGRNSLPDNALCEIKRENPSENQVRLMGLEPMTYGLKVRCSTD